MKFKDYKICGHKINQLKGNPIKNSRKCQHAYEYAFTTYNKGIQRKVKINGFILESIFYLRKKYMKERIPITRFFSDSELLDNS